MSAICNLNGISQECEAAIWLVRYDEGSHCHYCPECIEKAFLHLPDRFAIVQYDPDGTAAIEEDAGIPEDATPDLKAVLMFGSIRNRDMVRRLARVLR